MEQTKLQTPTINNEEHVEIALPSKGLVYPKDSYLSKGIVKLRYMKGRDENIFANQAYIKQGNVMEMLLKELCPDKEFEPLDLIVADKVYLLIAVRIMALGDEIYLSDVTCPVCEHYTPKLEISLTNIKEEKDVIEPPVPYINEYPFTLPHSKHAVKLQILDGHKQFDFVNKVKRTNDKQLFTLLTAMVIKEEPITKSTSFGAILEFVENLSPKDTNAIRKRVTEISGLIDPKIIHTCPNCKTELPINVTIDETFFFPNT